MAAVLVVFLSAMVITYTLVALATVKIWRPVPHREDHDEDHPERLVDREAVGQASTAAREPLIAPPRVAGCAARTIDVATND